MSIAERVGELVNRIRGARQALETDLEACPITPGDYVVKKLAEPYINVVTVYGEEFESGSLAHLSAGDTFTVVSEEPAKVSYRRAPWWAAGSPGKPARPRDGSWPAVVVEVEQGGKTIQGLIPLFSFDRVVPA